MRYNGFPPKIICCFDLSNNLVVHTNLICPKNESTFGFIFVICEGKGSFEILWREVRDLNYYWLKSVVGYLKMKYSFKKMNVRGLKSNFDVENNSQVMY